jgi:hypothetical protein
MLKVKKLVKNEDGYEATWQLSADQAQFLLSYAINTLVAKGLAEVEEIVDERQNQN